MGSRRLLRLVVAGGLMLTFSACFCQRSPLQLARAIADRVITDTDLSLQLVEQKPLAGLQAVDFSRLFGRDSISAAYAFSILLSDRDTIVSLGVSHDCPLQIWVNGAGVYEQSSGRALLLREIGYDLFRFQDTITVHLHKGENRALVKGILSCQKNVAYLKELTLPGRAAAGKFSLTRIIPGASGAPWLFAGPFRAKRDPYGESFPPEKSSGPAFLLKDSLVLWKQAPVPLVSEFVIKPTAAYTKESYAEWMYPNGTVLLSLLHLSSATGDQAYVQFVRGVCEFTLSNLSVFQYQYENLHARRAANYRIFRRSMLDDTGAPVLPYVELLPGANDPRLRGLVDTMGAYVSEGQVRLPDGTLCRYEPAPFTIWADDLFMSVPFLLRLGEQQGLEKYFDDAAKQILNFNRYLVDRTTGLYRHGYYEYKKEQSPIAWGRANGWVVWAHSEALLHLPKNHPTYHDITLLFRRHMEALVAVQGTSGLWHQILERPDSFEETSCTAMFMIGLARGIRLGILDKGFKEALRRGWVGLQSKISGGGVVKDICRGTGIGNDPSFYLLRERFDNDPRGLGAVITALVEAEPLVR